MSRPTRTARAAAFVASAAFFLLGGVVFAGSANAHHPEIEATWDCDGTVTYTARSWAGDTDDSKTNPSIDVSWTEDQAHFTGVPADVWNHVRNDHFGPDNGFQFSGSFVVTTTAPTIGLFVTEGADWANGTARRGPGQEDASQFARIAAPEGCEEPPTECPNVEGDRQPADLPEDCKQTPPEEPPVFEPPVIPPSASIADATCLDGGAIVTLVNGGSSDVTFTVAGGAAPVVRQVGAGTTSYLVVPVGTTPNQILVTAPGMADVARTLSQNCARPTPNPAATIADASCTEEGALVELANTGTAPVTFTIAGPAGTVTRDVPAGGQGSEVVDLPGGSGTITVTAPGMTTVSRSFAVQCAAAEVRSEVIERPARVSPVNLVAPVAAAQAAPAGELPRTGASSTELLFRLGAALLMVGLALALAPVVGRRRMTGTTV
jgi:hypothetical protein